MVKSKLNFFFEILIFFTLITLSSPNQVPKRFLQYDSNSKANNTQDDSTSFAEDPGTYLLVWFAIFIIMGLYMIVSMKDIPEYKEKTGDVWHFMFFANNGILVVSCFNMINHKNIVLDSISFGLGIIVFLVGCICSLVNICRTCNNETAGIYFQCTKIKELAIVPLFICSLVGLTDPCCRSDTYTEYIYEDGHKEDDKCYVECFNWIVYIIKRLALLFTFLSYYIFFVVFLFIWLIPKIFFSLCHKNNKETNDGNNNVQEPEPPLEVNVNDIINQNIGKVALSNDELFKRGNQNNINIINNQNISVSTSEENKSRNSDINNNKNDKDINNIMSNIDINNIIKNTVNNMRNFSDIKINRDRNDDEVPSNRNINELNKERNGNEVNNDRNNNDIQNINKNVIANDRNNNDINNIINNININDNRNKDEIQSSNRNDLEIRENALPEKEEVEREINKPSQDDEKQITEERREENDENPNREERQDENNNREERQEENPNREERQDKNNNSEERQNENNNNLNNDPAPAP